MDYTSLRVKDGVLMLAIPEQCGDAAATPLAPKSPDGVKGIRHGDCGFTLLIERDENHLGTAMAELGWNGDDGLRVVDDSANGQHDGTPYVMGCEWT